MRLLRPSTPPPIPMQRRQQRQQHLQQPLQPNQLKLQSSHPFLPPPPTTTPQSSTSWNSLPRRRPQQQQQQQHPRRFRAGSGGGGGGGSSSGRSRPHIRGLRRRGRPPTPPPPPTPTPPPLYQEANSEPSVYLVAEPVHRVPPSRPRPPPRQERRRDYDSTGSLPPGEVARRLCNGGGGSGGGSSTTSGTYHNGNSNNNNNNNQMYKRTQGIRPPRPPPQPNRYQHYPEDDYDSYYYTEEDNNVDGCDQDYYYEEEGQQQYYEDVVEDDAGKFILQGQDPVDRWNMVASQTGQSHPLQHHRNRPLPGAQRPPPPPPPHQRPRTMMRRIPPRRFSPLQHFQQQQQQQQQRQEPFYYNDGRGVVEGRDDDQDYEDVHSSFPGGGQDLPIASPRTSRIANSNGGRSGERSRRMKVVVSSSKEDEQSVPHPRSDLTDPSSVGSSIVHTPLAPDDDEADLESIRRRFLKNDSQSASSSSSWGVAGSRHVNDDVNDNDNEGGDDEAKTRDTEGLPPGFYRRTDGVIFSFDSSSAGGSRVSRARYDSSFQMGNEEEDENSTLGTSAQKWNPPTGKGARESKMATMAIISPPQVRRKKEVPSIDSSVRRAKSKKWNGNSAKSASVTNSSFRGTKIGSSKSKGPYSHSLLDEIRVEGTTLGGDSFSYTTQTYDDSTITTRDSGIAKLKALVDLSRMQMHELEKPKKTSKEEASRSGSKSQKAEHGDVRSPSPAAQLLKTQKKLEEQVRLLQQKNECKAESSTGKPTKRDGLWQSQLQEGTATGAVSDSATEEDISLNKTDSKRVGFGGEYPEPTPQGERVPEMLITHKANPGMPLNAIVSDISSAQSKQDSFSSSSNGITYRLNPWTTGPPPAVVSDDMIGGFFDKLLLAFRLAVAEPNVCKKEPVQQKM